VEVNLRFVVGNDLGDIEVWCFGLRMARPLLVATTVVFVAGNVGVT
jgi:hypothetical protein